MTIGFRVKSIEGEGGGPGGGGIFCKFNAGRCEVGLRSAAWRSCFVLYSRIYMYTAVIMSD